jgi:hypothetical protein
VVVSPGHGVGGDVTEKPDKAIRYNGTQITLKF